MVKLKMIAKDEKCAEVLKVEKKGVMVRCLHCSCCGPASHPPSEQDNQNLEQSGWMTRDFVYLPDVHDRSSELIPNPLQVDVWVKMNRAFVLHMAPTPREQNRYVARVYVCPDCAVERY